MLGGVRRQNLVLDFVYLFYPFLIPFPLTFLLAIVAVAVAASRYPVGPSPSLLYGVVVLGSIPSHPCKILEGFCVAPSLMRLI